MTDRGLDRFLITLPFVVLAALLVSALIWGSLIMPFVPGIIVVVVLGVVVANVIRVWRRRRTGAVPVRPLYFAPYGVSVVYGQDTRPAGR
jgi:hypothetical protein